MRSQFQRRAGYLMNEALVYISLVFVLLGVGYAALYACMRNSVNLRRGAEDITSALQAGERWRADLRSAGPNITAEAVEGAQVLQWSAGRTNYEYAFYEGAVSRRVNGGPWVTLLREVKFSSMGPDQRPGVKAWRWDLELKTRAKYSRMRPLFTFLAVPQSAEAR